MTIPQRILVHVAAGAGLSIAVATLVTYGFVYRSAKERELAHLNTYVTERARREEIGFQQVQANLALVRGQFLKRMESGPARNVDGQWKARFELFPDGAWRSRKEFADGRKHSTLWAHKDTVLTPELKTQVLRAQNICDELLPGWADVFPSVYFVLPGWLNIGFDPRIPNWVWDTPADYDASGLEWFQLALPANRLSSAAESAGQAAAGTESPDHPPATAESPWERRSGEFVWSGVSEEPTTKVPIVSVYLPLEQNGRFLGSVGHDLFVNRLMEETTRSGLPGTSHFIFRRDGRLIAHPTKRREILAGGGRLTMENSGEPALASLYRAVSGRTERQFAGYDDWSKSYYRVARLAGPEWFFLTTMPGDQLRRLAFQSAQWVLWSGLATLALMLGFLGVTLRRQIARPLAELTRATRQMSGGDVSARADVSRSDELGRLARAFNEMAERVADRDAALRTEKSLLERRVAERTSELARFASIAEATGDFFGFADLDERLLYINPAGRRMIGLSPDEPLDGLRIRDVHPAHAYQQIRGGMLPVGLREGSCFAESALQHRDGREIPVSMMLVIPRTDDGQPMFVSAILHDISGRKEAEARLLESERRLRESEARLSLVFQNSPAIQSLIRATDATVVEVNDRFLSQLGYRREEVVGKTPFELNAPEDQEALVAYRQKLEAEGFVQNHEIRMRARDGRLLTLLLSTFPVTIDGVPHFVSAGVDITARKEAEARTRALYESLSAAVVVHDQSGFLQINPATLRLFGAARPEDILGKHPAHFSAPRQPNGEDSATAARRHLERAYASGTEKFEWLARRLDGTEFPVEVTLTALRLEGRPVLQAVINDLTERRRAEAELQNALAQERELSQLRSEFVSLVSHEFRTPLEIIMSSVDNLLRYHDRLPPQQREQLLRTVNKSVRRMSGMMEEVLVLGRLETDRMSFHPAPLDLPSLCRRLCEEIAATTGNRCVIDLQADEMAEPANGDESLLRHIFSNLLSNAVKYSPEGARVAFTVRRDRESAVCRVADCGCGIPTADQKRMFQAFHRGSNVGQVPGTGLGLLIVQRCVSLHGGALGFESAEGRGTTFTVRLPLFTPAPPTP